MTTVTFRGEALTQVGPTREAALNAVKDTLVGRFITTDADGDVAVWPDGVVASSVESQFTSRIFDAFRLDGGTPPKTTSGTVWAGPSRPGSSATRCTFWG